MDHPGTLGGLHRGRGVGGDYFGYQGGAGLVRAGRLPGVGRRFRHRDRGRQPEGRFNADPANKGKFISTGLWSKSRHPNYFGEILLWIGVAIVAVPALQGWQWVALISPVFVTLLLTKVSGVPLLEKKSDSKWGGQEDYEAYKKNTPSWSPSSSSSTPGSKQRGVTHGHPGPRDGP